MTKKPQPTLTAAINCLHAGGVIAYPTEAVYGLGCDPFNADAVTRLLQIKHRSIKKGFILIASDWKQIQFLVEPIDPQKLVRVFASWPGPITWVFPATTEVPYWVRGEHTSIAVRVTAHPLAKALCEQYGKPLISTSANLDGYPPVRDARTLQMTFGDKLDLILPGQLGNSRRPTEIRDAITGEIIRPA
jgi:L-threonylcarbamoyladenylate synthase